MRLTNICGPASDGGLVYKLWFYAEDGLKEIFMKNNNRWASKYCSISFDLTRSFFLISVDNPKWEYDGRSQSHQNAVITETAHHSKCTIITKSPHPIGSNRFVFAFFLLVCVCVSRDRENEYNRCSFRKNPFCNAVRSLVRSFYEFNCSNQRTIICNFRIRKAKAAKKWIPDAQLDIAANAVKNNTYEWNLITRLDERMK